MKAYSDYLGAVTGLVKNNDNILTSPSQGFPSDYDLALQVACATYSRYKPLWKTCVYTQAVADNRIFALPTDWDNEYSAQRFTIELPVDVTVSQDTFLDSNMGEIYYDTSVSTPVWVLRFRDTMEYSPVPDLNATFNFKYGVPQLLDRINGVTIPDSHFWPVVYCAAAAVARIKADYYSGLASSNIDGSSQVDYRNKYKTQLDLSDRYYSEFAKEIIPPEADTSPAFVFGKFVENPLHHAPYPLWWKDTDKRKNVYT